MALVKVPTITSGSPLVALATEAEIEKTVAEIAYMFGHKMHREFFATIVDEIIEGRWTKEELRLARFWIPKRKDLCKEINYNRTITPAIFTAARDLMDVKRGRLLTHHEAIDTADMEKSTIDKLFEPVSLDDKTWFKAK